MTLNIGTDAGKWTQIGTGDEAVYYYNGVVAANASTGYLINSCKLNEEVTLPGDGYNLQVTILSESIQADGMASATETAVHNAWGHSYDAATGWSDS
jgi:hypothetical protein